MPDTNDEAQQADQPPANQPRRTAMQVAEQALTEAGNVSALFEGLSEKFTDLDQRTRDAAGPNIADTVRWGDEIAQVRRENERLGGELRATREEMGGYIGATNRRLDDHRMRLTELEKLTSGDGAGTMMAEDAQSDAVESLVKTHMGALMARLEAAEKKAAAAELALQQGMKLANPVAGVDPQYVSELGDRVTALEYARPHAAYAGVQELVDAGGPVGGVHAKVLRVMQMVTALGKDHQITEGRQRYTYRSIDDAMDAVGHAMREVGLVYTTEITSREVSRDSATNREGRALLWTSVMLTVRYTFIDPDDGSTQSFEMAGEGRASDDKATSKAAAMALKYGLLHALMIPVSGAIPDGDAESPQVISDRPPPRQDAPPQREQAEQPEQPRKPLVERARDAVKALQNIHQVPADQRHDRVMAIGNQAGQLGILDIPVDTGDGAVPVRGHLRATMELLATQPASGPSGAF